MFDKLNILACEYEINLTLGSVMILSLFYLLYLSKKKTGLAIPIAYGPLLASANFCVDLYMHFNTPNDKWTRSYGTAVRMIF